MLDVLGDGTLVLDVAQPARQPARAASTQRPRHAAGALDHARQQQRPAAGVFARRQDGALLLEPQRQSRSLDHRHGRRPVRRITDDGAEDWDPAFTPDGKKIVWSSGRSGNLEIWIANADGSGARQISHDGVDAENPTATPDGMDRLQLVQPARSRASGRCAPDGTQATHLVKARTSLPEVSPDGQYVSYLVDGRTPRASVRVARVSDGKDMGFSIPVRGRPPHQRDPRPHALDAGRQVDRVPRAERGRHQRRVRAGLRPRHATRRRRAARSAASIASAPRNRSASRRTARP